MLVGDIIEYKGCLIKLRKSYPKNFYGLVQDKSTHKYIGLGVTGREAEAIMGFPIQFYGFSIREIKKSIDHFLTISN